MKENLELRHELEDLKLMLDAVTGHADGIESLLLEKVQAGEMLFQVISKTIPVPFVIISEKDGRTLFSNEHAQRLFGYSQERFSLVKVHELYENSGDIDKLTREMLVSNHVNDYEVILKKSDGTIFLTSLFSQPIHFKEQECRLTVIYDLTERKKAEEEKLMLEKQLRQTQKLEAIGTLASGIAHDFNNVLSVIFGKLQVAMMVLGNKSEKAVKNINDALDAARRAQAMVMQILTFCRQQEQEKKPFKIALIMSEVAKMLQAMITPDIKIKLTIQNRTSIVMGDPTQVHQVVMNLCANATHALQGQGGIIDISLKEVRLDEDDQLMIPRLKPGSYAKLSVVDNGPGMNKGIAERVFDPFFTTKPHGEGTGLGLSVVHGIVENHEGAVSVESEPGKGAAFHCYFPLIEKEEKVNEEPPVIESVYRGSNERILLVDNEKSILEAYGDMLTALGYRLTLKNTSQGALKLFEENPDQFDIVVTDNLMPGMSGKNLARTILDIRPDIPVILCSGTDHGIDREELKGMGIRSFILKPFTQPQIAELIKKTLGGSS
ncbi:MAG: response regulator [Desulfamplus sp.]|nr:response regulator [Desulfamplus sp.]